MRRMFKDCSGLEKILNTNTWRCEESQDMFDGCIRLKGAVKFDASKVDVKMANPESGYFFDPNKKVAYVQQSEDKHTLTFFYDVNRTLRSGKTWDIDEKSKPAWAGTYNYPNKVVTKVVFDASFRNFLPTTTKAWFSSLQILSTIEGIENLNTSAVTDMGYMFSGCSSLKELNVSNFNTAKVTNMSGMFEGCSGLTSLNLSNFNTSKVTNMSDMFSGCYNLTSLNVSNFNTSAVTNMARMFWRCSILKELNVSNFNTSAVTYMCDMFNRCYNLTSLNVSNFNTSAVTDMRDMFSDCSSLKTIINTQTWQCEKSQDMFKGCTQLNGAVKYDDKKLDATMANPTTGYFTDPNREYPKAYVLQSEDQHTLTFYYDNNRKLRSGKTWDIDEKSSSSKPIWAGTDISPDNVVTKVKFDASFKDFRPTTTKYWFSDLKALTTIEGIENLNTSAVKDMSMMFSGCSSLKTILNTNTWRCEKSQDMFKGCTQLKGAVKYDDKKLDVTMANPETGYFTDLILRAYVQQSEDNETLTFYYDTNRAFRSGKTWRIDVKVIVYDYKNNINREFPVWAGTYYSLNKVVTKVVFDASFKNLLPTTTRDWFYNMKALTTIDGLENLNTSAVADMSSMFDGCSSLKELNLSNFNTAAVTDMELMFSGCSRLTSLNLSNFNTSNVTDMLAMFSGCSSLTELNLSNFNTSAVTDMRDMFSGCSSLKTIFNPNTWGCEQSQDMFKGCTQLKGAVKYDGSKVDATMANPETGYFSQKLPSALGRVVFDDNNATQIYTLQGKRVNANQRHLPAGFYIVNGKKVYLNEKL